MLTSFSTNTATGLNTVGKKKVKATPLMLEPTSHHGAVGGKLYEKIRTGISGNTQQHAGTPQQVQVHSLKHNLQSNYNSNQNPVSVKKKPSTIFTFNNK